MIKTSNA